jgi:hypothetical protein
LGLHLRRFGRTCRVLVVYPADEIGGGPVTRRSSQPDRNDIEDPDRKGDECGATREPAASWGTPKR